MAKGYKIATVLALVAFFVLALGGVYNLYTNQPQKPKASSNTSNTSTQKGFTSLPSLPPTVQVLGQQPETGPEFWQLASLAAVVPVGFILSKYGKRKYTQQG